ncbi:uncharacterized protein LOC118203270 [Stegodyphus dumicola]|uniref:uncharacterized protein LOC118203270 n=1 Tax=Stegodyphus dumicola TaxID=202533 RepID=UPI0015AF6CF3|nr:uncharacterized protein LOC118203270 [Stegodyphus dumicola]
MAVLSTDKQPSVLLNWILHHQAYGFAVEPSEHLQSKFICSSVLNHWIHSEQLSIDQINVTGQHYCPTYTSDQYWRLYHARPSCIPPFDLRIHSLIEEFNLNDLHPKSFELFGIAPWQGSIFQSFLPGHFEDKRNLHPDPELHLDGSLIRVEPEAKILGVIFDRKLTFFPHILNLKKKCAKALNILKVLANTSWGAERCSMLRIYRALIRSKLDYGCVIYGSARPSVLLKLDPVHHQALRICCGAFRTSPVQSLYVICFEPSLDFRRKQLSIDQINVTGRTYCPTYDI